MVESGGLANEMPFADECSFVSGFTEILGEGRQGKGVILNQIGRLLSPRFAPTAPALPLADPE